MCVNSRHDFQWGRDWNASREKCKSDCVLRRALRIEDGGHFHVSFLFSSPRFLFSDGNYNCKYYLIRHEAAFSRLLRRKPLPASEWSEQLTAIIGCANHGASDRRHNAHRLSALALHLTTRRWLLSCDTRRAACRPRTRLRSLDASHDDLGIFRFWPQHITLQMANRES